MIKSVDFELLKVLDQKLKAAGESIKRDREKILRGPEIAKNIYIDLFLIVGVVNLFGRVWYFENLILKI